MKYVLDKILYVKILPLTDEGGTNILNQRLYIINIHGLWTHPNWLYSECWQLTY